MPKFREMSPEERKALEDKRAVRESEKLYEDAALSHAQNRSK